MDALIICVCMVQLVIFKNIYQCLAQLCKVYKGVIILFMLNTLLSSEEVGELATLSAF